MSTPSSARVATCVKCICRLLLLPMTVFLVACGGGNGGSSNAAVTYTIGGTVSGLSGTGLVLEDNSGNNLPVSTNGPFTFTTGIVNGSAYSVSVSSQPSVPTQTCVVTNGNGTLAGANVSNVQITCTTNSYTIGGIITGLSGSLVLQDNGGNNLPVSANGGFTFTTAIASGSAYEVMVLTQPSMQSCVVTNGSGTVASTNITGVQVACAYVGGIVVDSNATTSSTVHEAVFGTNWDANWSLDPSLPGPLRTVGTPHLRFPGGYWIDYYHWQTNTYSSCVSLVSPGLFVRTTFDTFMQSVVQPIGADAVIGVNYGSNPTCTGGADPNEAAAWVNYANNQMHYGVKYWTIGNEEYFYDPSGPPTSPSEGEIDLHNPPGATTYSTLVATQYYPLMKAQDPTIQIGVGVSVPYQNLSPGLSQWDSIVLNNAKFDFVEIHPYVVGAGQPALTDAALLTQGVSFFPTAIAELNSELAAAGKASIPIDVGEWGISGTRGKQNVSIVGGLWAAMVVGELIKANVSQAQFWNGDDPTCFTAPSDTANYGWQNWTTYGLLAPWGGVSGTSTSCSSLANMAPDGTLMSTGIAIELTSQAFQPNDQVIVPSVNSNLPTIKAYASKRSNGYGILLVNTDENNPVTTTLGIAKDARTFTATTLLYGKAQYDQSQTGVWVGPVSASLGTVNNPFSVTLPPWSMTIVRLTP